MQKIIDELQKIITDYSGQLKKINDEEFAFKPNPVKWSKKEILGHLVDSAQNNIRRFIVSQYEKDPIIIYRQDAWVSISNYQHYTMNNLIQLWVLLNKHICMILGNCSAEMAMRTCITNNNTPHTIEWLAGDYIRHLLHHLHQILPLEPIAYP
jgi:DinB superfamily